MLIAISFSNPGLKYSATLYMPGGMEERFANAKRPVTPAHNGRQRQRTKREKVDALREKTTRLQSPLGNAQTHY